MNNIFARTQNFTTTSGSPRYFAPSAAPSEGAINADPTVRTNGYMRNACRVPTGKTIVCKGFEIELEYALAAGGTLEVELIVDGEATGIKATIAAGNTIGSDFLASQTINGGQAFAYRFTLTGVTSCPAASLVMIVE